MSWNVEYEQDEPVRMRWTAARSLLLRRCPRTWPHDPHSPWHTGEIVPASCASAFSCPGVPLEDGSS